MTPQPRVRLVADIDPALNDKFREAATKRGKNVRTAIEEALEMWVERGEGE